MFTGARQSVSRVTAACTAVLLAVHLSTSIAAAATPVFVHPTDPDCRGKGVPGTTCFSTIQDGVNHAGPAPAVVNVFPGTYAESVDLSQMGSAIGGGTGDLTVQAVDNSGMPKAGATVSPAAGSAFRTSGGFLGDFTLDGFVAASGNTLPVDLSVAGMVMIADVKADNSPSTGIHVSASDDVTVENTGASGNGSFGVDLSSGGDIVVRNVKADGNSSTGIRTSGPGDATIDPTSASNNGSLGLDISSGGTVRVSGVTADGNAATGIHTSGPGDHAVESSSASDNGSHGVEISSGGDVLLRDVEADDNVATGIRTSGPGNHTVDPSSASGNGAHGVEISNSGLVTISALTAVGNTAGTGVKVSTATGLSLSLSDVRKNLVGVEISGPPGENYEVRCNNIADNSDTGLDSATPGTVAAESNWWGAATGPTHPNNPGGTGDLVQDGTNGGAGAVDFSPFLGGRFEFIAECGGHPASQAPLLSTSGLVLCALALLLLGSTTARARS